MTPLHGIACFYDVGFGARAVSRKTPIYFIDFHSALTFLDRTMSCSRLLQEQAVCPPTALSYQQHLSTSCTPAQQTWGHKEVGRKKLAAIAQREFLRDFLHFLWWEEENSSGTFQQFQQFLWNTLRPTCPVDLHLLPSFPSSPPPLLSFPLTSSLPFWDLQSLKKLPLSFLSPAAIVTPPPPY